MQKGSKQALNQAAAGELGRRQPYRGWQTRELMPAGIIKIFESFGESRRTTRLTSDLPPLAAIQHRRSLNETSRSALRIYRAGQPVIPDLGGRGFSRRHGGFCWGYQVYTVHRTSRDTAGYGTYPD
jgi:hypothetical protein